MKKVMMTGIEVNVPSPLYVLPETVEVVGERKLRAKCLFPSSDESIADRVDHVNQTHFMHVVWNLAALMRLQEGLKQTLAHRTVVITRRVTLPDVMVDVEFHAKWLRRKGEHRYGQVEAIFKQNGNQCAKVQCVCIAI